MSNLKPDAQIRGDENIRMLFRKLFGVYRLSEALGALPAGHLITMNATLPEWALTKRWGWPCNLGIAALGVHIGMPHPADVSLVRWIDRCAPQAGGGLELIPFMTAFGRIINWYLLALEGISRPDGRTWELKHPPSPTPRMDITLCMLEVEGFMTQLARRGR